MKYILSGDSISEKKGVSQVYEGEKLKSILNSSVGVPNDFKNIPRDVLMEYYMEYYNWCNEACSKQDFYVGSCISKGIVLDAVNGILDCGYHLSKKNNLTEDADFSKLNRISIIDSENSSKKAEVSFAINGEILEGDYSLMNCNFVGGSGYESNIDIFKSLEKPILNLISSLVKLTKLTNIVSIDIYPLGKNMLVSKYTGNKAYIGVKKGVPSLSETDISSNNVYSIGIFI